MTTENIVIRKSKNEINISVGSTTVDITDVGIHIRSTKKLDIDHPKSVLSDNYMIVWF